MDRRRREALLSGIDRTTFDVAVIGGGIKGACTYARLREAGYRVVLLESGDFACGSSQASAMMIWGGLLYLRNLDLPVVWTLSSERDRLVGAMPECVQPMPLRYVVTPGGRPSGLLWAALNAAWLMGCGRRALPRHEATFSEQAFLRPRQGRALRFEEAAVGASDSRYVLRWLGSASEDCPALAYCRLVAAGREAGNGCLRLDVQDALTGRPLTVRARWAVNAAGVWAEAVDRLAGIESSHVHVLSKGVFFSLPRLEGHHLPLILETREDHDCMTLLPWGPVSLWGPTETIAPDLQAAHRIEPGDVSLLLDELNRHLRRPVAPGDIVSLRCGVRPLAVRRGARVPGNTLGLSRHCVLTAHRTLPWISLFGGKLTDGPWIARRVARLLAGRLKPSLGGPRPMAPTPAVQRTLNFPGLDEPLSDPAGCAAHEACYRLEDYLRRRTNVAQWLRRGGLGSGDENLGTLAHVAGVLAGGDRERAGQDLESYRRSVENQFDRVLNALP